MSETTHRSTDRTAPAHRSGGWQRLMIWLPLAGLAGLCGLFAVALLEEPVPYSAPLEGNFGVPSFEIGRLDVASATVEPGTVTEATVLSEAPVLVNFFASWCAPCRIEHPVLLRLAGEENVPIIGIAYRDPAEASAAYLTSDGNPFTVTGFDLRGDSTVPWGVAGIPETFLVGANGTILHRIRGPITDVELRRLQPVLERAMAEAD